MKKPKMSSVLELRLVSFSARFLYVELFTINCDSDLFHNMEKNYYKKGGGGLMTEISTRID